MAVDIYSKTAWNNGTAPSLSKTQLDHIETGIKNNNTAIISLQSVQAECENYASESLASKIASASSATASASSALSALASANTAKTEADRAVAVAGVDIATDLVAGLVRGGGEVEVDANGDMSVPSKVSTSAIVNNLTTTVEGYVLDARQGKVLNDSLNSKVSTSATAISEVDMINDLRTRMIGKNIGTFIYVNNCTNRPSASSGWLIVNAFRAGTYDMGVIAVDSWTGSHFSCSIGSGTAWNGWV